MKAVELGYFVLGLLVGIDLVLAAIAAVELGAGLVAVR